MKVITRIDRVPVPNQITTSGAIAIIGTVERMMAYGYRVRSSGFHAVISNAPRTPTTALIAKPAKDVMLVRMIAAENSRPWRTIVAQMSVGVGRM